MTGIPQDRIDGAARASAHADAVHDGWHADAMAAFLERARGLSPNARLLGATFTMSEIVNSIAHERLPEPPDGRAWGAVAIALRRAKLIMPTGDYRHDKFGSPKPVYRLVER
jgi:hypothetical protein